MTEVIRKVLTGSGECSEVNWTFLGLAMPAWVLICALVLGAFGVSANAVTLARLGQQVSAARPTYMRCSASMSATRTLSLTLWMRGVDDAQLHHLRSQRRDEAPV